MLSRISIEPNEEQRRRDSVDASVIEPFAQTYERWEVRLGVYLHPDSSYINNSG